MKLKKNIKQIKGDASLRSFFRIKKKKLSSIIVYAKKDKKINLLTYDSINKILLRNNILAPKLLSESYSKNYIEIQDFGNQTIFGLLKKNKVDKISIFKQIIKLLIKLQSIPERKIKNFKKKKLYNPYISFKNLIRRSNTFCRLVYCSKII